MLTKSSSQLNKRNRGFTLVEIMVVITIIAILIGITTMVVGNVLNAGKEKQTRATIKKIDELAKDRLRAFRINKEKGRFDGEISRVYLNWSNPPSFGKDLVSVCVYKHNIGKYFGVDYLLDPTSYNDGSSNPVASEEEQKAFAAEILYELITKGTIAGENPVPQVSMTAAELDFSSGEIADTDGDGRMEFVDGWGQPIRYYLWPTEVTKPNAGSLVSGNLALRLLIPPAADRTDEVLERDPDDPKGALSRASASHFSDLNSLGSFFYTLATDQPHQFDTYHSFLIVSSGQDETLGVEEPVTSILGQPVGSIDPSQNDSGDADHFYNSVMNDDITNYQGPGGS